MNEEREHHYGMAMMALPMTEVQEIVEELTPLALQLGPASRRFYEALSNGLEEWKVGKSSDTIYDTRVKP